MDCCLRARVGPRVRPAEPPRLYPSVRLGRTDAGVAEQLLDRAQIGAALEQMGGVRVTEGVRRYSRALHRAVKAGAQAAADVGGGEPAPAPREEQGGLGALAGGRGLGKLVASAGQVQVDCPP